jgi:mannose-6-phosphate isomerase-like protein (cupin superfamily)
MPTHNRPIICRPGEGERLAGPADVLRADRDELGLFEGVVEPGQGNNPHLHRQHADAFYVLEGELDVFVGAVRARLGPGGLMIAPPGVSHFFRNTGFEQERNLNLHAPGERFIALARARARGETPDAAEFDTFAPEPGGEGVVSGPGEGDRLKSEHGEWLVKAVLPQLNVIEQELTPGATDGLHFHQRHVESFYVLAGSLEFTIDDKDFHATEGTSVLVPPGVAHAFRNSGSETARVLNVHAPESGYVDYLRASARGDEVDPAHYDVHYVH